MSYLLDFSSQSFSSMLWVVSPKTPLCIIYNPLPFVSVLGLFQVSRNRKTSEDRHPLLFPALIMLETYLSCRLTMLVTINLFNTKYGTRVMSFQCFTREKFTRSITVLRKLVLSQNTKASRLRKIV